jgi:hypothetical protein
VQLQDFLVQSIHQTHRLSFPLIVSDAASRRPKLELQDLLISVGSAGWLLYSPTKVGRNYPREWLNNRRKSIVFGDATWVGFMDLWFHVAHAILLEPRVRAVWNDLATQMAEKLPLSDVAHQKVLSYVAPSQLPKPLYFSTPAPALLMIPYTNSCPIGIVPFRGTLEGVSIDHIYVHVTSLLQLYPCPGLGLDVGPDDMIVSNVRYCQLTRAQEYVQASLTRVETSVGNAYFAAWTKLIMEDILQHLFPSIRNEWLEQHQPKAQPKPMDLTCEEKLPPPPPAEPAPMQLDLPQPDPDSPLSPLVEAVERVSSPILSAAAAKPTDNAEVSDVSQFMTPTGAVWQKGSVKVKRVREPAADLKFRPTPRTRKPNNNIYAQVGEVEVELLYRQQHSNKDSVSSLDPATVPFFIPIICDWLKSSDDMEELMLSLPEFARFLSDDEESYQEFYGSLTTNDAAKKHPLRAKCVYDLAESLHYKQGLQYSQAEMLYKHRITRLPLSLQHHLHKQWPKVKAAFDQVVKLSQQRPT